MNSKLLIILLIVIVIFVITTAKSLKNKAMEIIKFYEGFEPYAYKDAAGLWTIGFGTLIEKNINPTLYKKFVEQGQEISREDAEGLLLTHIKNEVEPKLASLVKVPLNQNQKDSLTSFIYNVGSGAFAGSTLLKKLNQSDYNGAAAEFSKWVYAGGNKLAGLEKRRKEEQILFLS